MANPKFTGGDVFSIHHAFQVAFADANERARKGMAGSAEAVRAQAANLKKVRDKILSTMPDSARETYLDYEPPVD